MKNRRFLVMPQRSGEVVIRLLENVQQKTIKSLILQTVAAGTQVYTDEYTIYNRLEEWGFQHKTVNHSAHEYYPFLGRTQVN
ncbi:MAG: transposase [Methylococcales bacterium]|nr:transposase [Methylococcales bacterium]